MATLLLLALAACGPESQRADESDATFINPVDADPLTARQDDEEARKERRRKGRKRRR